MLFLRRVPNLQGILFYLYLIRNQGRQAYMISGESYVTFIQIDGHCIEMYLCAALPARLVIQLVSGALSINSWTSFGRGDWFMEMLFA